MKPYTPSDLEQEAISLVNLEKSSWEDATAFITEKVAFQMRNLIRQLRKNFWGVFDEPTDPTTKRKKIWIPLTESLIDAVVKNIDLDTKDINFRAKKPESIGLTNIVRHIVMNYLDRLGFGEYLDEFEKTLAIDGTAVWKTVSYKEDGEWCVKILPVDLLNIYIDPTARSIAEAYRFTERSLMTESQVKAQDWINTEGIEGTVGLNPTDSLQKFSQTSTSKFIDVWELWGKIPKSLITGGKEKEEVEGHIIVSGLDSPGKERVHLIEENKGKRPYEEAWYSRVPGRWYGRGIAEKVLMLQLWINTIVNIRITRATVSQLGIFKIRKGSGVTPQMLSRLPANGAVVLNNMDDLQQLVMQEASQASYTDEQNVWDWSQKNTSAFDAAIGESLPASTPATNASISNTNSKSAFVLIKEQLGMFLERWMKNQYLPVIFKNITRDEVIRISGAEVKDLDERIVYEEVFNQLSQMNQAGVFVDPLQVQLEVEKALASLQQMGNDRYVKLLHDLDVIDYDTEVSVTNEKFDKATLSRDLMTQLQTLPALMGSGIDVGSLAVDIMKEAWDLAGMDASRIKKAPAPMMPPQNPMNPNNAALQGGAQLTRPGGNPKAPNGATAIQRTAATQTMGQV